MINDRSDKDSDDACNTEFDGETKRNYKNADIQCEGRRKAKTFAIIKP